MMSVHSDNGNTTDSKSGNPSSNLGGRIYKIDDGNVFEGTVDQFRDCFFDNASHENIVAFANENNVKIEWTDLE